MKLVPIKRASYDPYYRKYLLSKRSPLRVYDKEVVTLFMAFVEIGYMHLMYFSFRNIYYSIYIFFLLLYYWTLLFLDATLHFFAPFLYPDNYTLLFNFLTAIILWLITFSLCLHLCYLLWPLIYLLFFASPPL